MSWFPMSKVGISRLIHILCLSMVDYWSRVLRSHSTMDSVMVYLEGTVLERCVSICVSFFISS